MNVVLCRSSGWEKDGQLMKEGMMTKMNMNMMMNMNMIMNIISMIPEYHGESMISNRPLESQISHESNVLKNWKLPSPRAYRHAIRDTFTVFRLF